MIWRAIESLFTRILIGRWRRPESTRTAVVVNFHDAETPTEPWNPHDPDRDDAA